MNQILYQFRCKCKEEFSITNKFSIRNEGKPLRYPSLYEFYELDCKTFQIKYEKKLSSIAKFLLNSFQNKYLYYAIDDILDLFKSNPTERDNLLTILYSPVLSLQNNRCIDFFEIWISEFYISEVSKRNKFLTNNYENLDQFTYITITLEYRIKFPIKKREPLW